MDTAEYTVGSNKYIPIAEEALEAGCYILRNNSLLVTLPPGVNIERMATSVRFARLRKVDQFRILMDQYAHLDPETQMRMLVESLY